MKIENWWSYVTECWVCNKSIKTWENRYIDGIKHYHINCKIMERGLPKVKDAQKS